METNEAYHDHSIYIHLLRNPSHSSDPGFPSLDVVTTNKRAGYFSLQQPDELFAHVMLGDSVVLTPGGLSPLSC